MDIITDSYHFYKQVSLIHIWAVQQSKSPKARHILFKEVMHDFKMIMLVIDKTNPIRKPITKHLKLRLINRPESSYEFKVSVEWDSEKHSMLITRNNQHLFKRWVMYGFKPHTLDKWKEYYGD